VKLPDLTADQTSDLIHATGIICAAGMVVRLLGWEIHPTEADIMFVGMLFAGGIINSKTNGTPGA